MERLKMKTITTWMVACLAATMMSAQAEEWNWRVTPYAWLSGLEGDSTVSGVSSELDESFSDVLDNLDMSAMITFDANKGNWGVLGDFIWVDLESSSSTALGKITTDVEEFIISAVPYYRLVSDEAKTLDVGAGIVLVDLDMNITTPGESEGGSQDWIDPIILARLTVPVAEKSFLACVADVGGFGVASDFTWELIVQAGYSITENVELVVGYRHLDIDYEDGDFAYDVATTGFLLGAHLSF